MSILQYIKESKYETQMFKIISTDKNCKKLSKIITIYDKNNEPCNLIFIKNKKIKECELKPKCFYNLKVSEAGTYKNYPVLKYDLKECAFKHSNINNKCCSIDYSSDTDTE